MQMAGADIRRLANAHGQLRPIQELEDNAEVLIAGLKITPASRRVGFGA